jgi:hypothetical protein
VDLDHPDLGAPPDVTRLCGGQELVTFGPAAANTFSFSSTVVKS